MIFGRVYKRQNQKSDSIGDNFRFTTFQIYGINPKRKLQITMDASICNRCKSYPHSLPSEYSEGVHGFIYIYTRQPSNDVNQRTRIQIGPSFVRSLKAVQNSSKHKYTYKPHNTTK